MIAVIDDTGKSLSQCNWTFTVMFQLDVFRESTLVQKTELLFQSRAPRLGNSSNTLDSCALTPLLLPRLLKILKFCQKQFYHIYFLSSAAPPPLSA
jgi:hypothetical protein